MRLPSPQALPPALIASTLAWFIHREIMEWGNIMPPPLFPELCVSSHQIWLSLPMGLFAGGVTYGFVRVRRVLESLPYPTAIRGLVRPSTVPCLLSGPSVAHAHTDDFEPLVAGDGLAGRLHCPV